MPPIAPAREGVNPAQPDEKVHIRAANGAEVLGRLAAEEVCQLASGKPSSREPRGACAGLLLRSGRPCIRTYVRLGWGDAALLRRRRPARGARPGEARPGAGRRGRMRLFALASAPTGDRTVAPRRVVSGDARLAWRGAAVGLRAPPAPSLPARARRVRRRSTSRRPGCRPRRAGSSRSARSGSWRSSSEDASRRSSIPGVALPPAITALTGIGPRTCRGAPGTDLAVRRLLDFAGDAVLVAHNARFDLGVPRPRGRAAHRTPRRGAGRRHGLARTTPARRARRGGSASPRSRTSSARAPALPSRAPRRAGDGRDPAAADRAGPGAGRAHGRRPRRARRAAGAPAPRQARARRQAPAAPGHLRLPRPPRPGALRRAARATCAARLRSYFARRRGSGPPSRPRSAALDPGRVGPLGNELEAALRGAAPAARAAAACERSQHPARPSRLPAPSRIALGRAAPSRRRYGPLRSRQARAPRGAGARRLRGRRPVGARCRRCASGCGGSRGEQRFEDAARLRDRIAALEQVVASARGARPAAGAPRLPGRSRARTSASCARSSSPAGRVAASPHACRAAAVRGSRSRPAWRSRSGRDAVARPPRTRTSSSLRRHRSCAARRRSCASPARRGDDPGRACDGVALAA